MSTFVNYLLIFVSFNVFAQETYTLSGYITDQQTGEALIGATVMDTLTNAGTVTNGYGFYSLSLPKDTHVIVFSYVGYQSIHQTVELTNNITKNIYLEPAVTGLNQITVTATSSEKLTGNEFGAEHFGYETIASMPGMTGEADVIKAIQLEPGIKTLGDGSSGMFVRGGSADQNLILIDEAPVYNPSHLFGLVSIFNAEALNHIELHKSNMPARYGGRVSAVIDAKMKEGNTKYHEFSAGLSPFTATLTLNGPVIREESSFFVSARKSLVDLFLDPGSALSIVPAFYDLNMKANSRLTPNDRLFLSFYTGQDQLESTDGFFNKWGNNIASVRWNHQFSASLFSNTSMIFSNYKNYMEFNDVSRSYRWLTGIQDFQPKVDFAYYIRPQNRIEFGIGSIIHRFIPGETSDTLESLPRIRALDHSVYLMHDLDPIQWIGINYGLRISAFQAYGQYRWYTYDENFSPTGEEANRQGIFKTYINLEPRINLRFKVGRKQSLKAGYARNAQYMQVLQNASLSYTSLETWFPATPNVKPVLADVVSATWYQSFGKGYEWSLTGYYKFLQNQIDYVDHALLVNNPLIEGDIRKGTATVYGAEFTLAKTSGRLTGRISYNYSRALRKIEGINEGQRYRAPFDMPHDLRVLGQYEVNSKWNVSANWMYMSGRPATFPIGFYYKGREPVPIYSDRNGHRFPVYHRLDVSANHIKRASSGRSFWSFSFGLFNAYGRKNPLGYEFKRRVSTKNINVYRYTLFTILPNFSVKYNYMAK